MSVWDGFILVGVGMLAYSAYLVSPALMWLTLGIALNVIGFGGHWNASRKNADDSQRN